MHENLLHSMTGHGHALGRHGPLTIDVEVRTVNNRFLKVSSKISEIANAIEPELDSIVRKHIRRGTVQLSIRVSQPQQSNASRVCADTLRSYIQQAQNAVGPEQGPIPMELGSILQLPGVLENRQFKESEGLIISVARVVEDALVDLNRMRLAEGQSMATQLLNGIQEIEGVRVQIESRAPAVIEEYRRRLENRVRSALADLGHTAVELDLLREVLQYSDRCDIREELVRLECHLEQMRKSMQVQDPQGRRLDFLIQELFREVNTIGSKANDASIAHDVVTVKTVIEQMRELIQNVE